MAEVYRATDERSGTIVALKMLRMQHTQNPDLVRRARMEALLLAEIRHPNVVRVLDSGVTDDGIVWMAMEMLSGQTLRGVLQDKGALPLRLALHYIGGIVDGVAEAHRRSVVHRDIKPENVFITDRNEVRVLDLGTAKFFGYGLKTTDQLVIIGTVPYMSPEHMAGEPIDARTDIYAIGVMLYEMLAGRHPFEEAMTSSLEMCMAHMFRVPRPLRSVAPHVPDYLEAVVSQAMSKKRKERFRSMVELRFTLTAVLRRYEREQREAAEWEAQQEGLFEQRGLADGHAGEHGGGGVRRLVPKLRTARIFESPPPPKPPDLNLLYECFEADGDEAPGQQDSPDALRIKETQPFPVGHPITKTVELPREAPPVRRERDSEDSAVRTWTTPKPMRRLRLKQVGLLLLLGCFTASAVIAGAVFVLSLQRAAPIEPVQPAAPLVSAVSSVDAAAPASAPRETAVETAPKAPVEAAVAASSGRTAVPVPEKKAVPEPAPLPPKPKKSGPMRRRLF